MSSVNDILTAAALQIGAVQLGENLTANESDIILKTWQRLIDSLGLNRANLTTIRQDTYTLTPGQQTYTLGLDPTSAQFTISSATNASSCVLTLATAHGIPVGGTNSVVISNGAGNWQAINGAFIALALSTTTLSIPVNSTSFGSLTGNNVSLRLGGTWNSVRPTNLKRMNLEYSSSVFTPVSSIDDEQYADIPYLQVDGPPLRYYNDKNAPLSTVYLYPIPDQAYQVICYSEQALENVSSLSSGDMIIFAQGYDRYWITALAIEIAPVFGLTPSQTLLQNAQDARNNVQTNNRRAPALKTDPILSRKNNFLYNYRLGT